MPKDEFIRRAAAIYSGDGGLQPADAMSAAEALWDTHGPSDGAEALAREDLSIWAESEGGEL